MAKVAAGAVPEELSPVEVTFGAAEVAAGTTRARLGRVNAGTGAVRTGFSPAKVAPGAATVALGVVKVALWPPLSRPGPPVVADGIPFRARGARSLVDEVSSRNFTFATILRERESEVPGNLRPRITPMESPASPRGRGAVLRPRMGKIVLPLIMSVLIRAHPWLKILCREVSKTSWKVVNRLIAEYQGFPRSL